MIFKNIYAFVLIDNIWINIYVFLFHFSFVVIIYPPQSIYRHQPSRRPDLGKGGDRTLGRGRWGEGCKCEDLACTAHPVLEAMGQRAHWRWGVEPQSKHSKGGSLGQGNGRRLW